MGLLVSNPGSDGIPGPDIPAVWLGTATATLPEGWSGAFQTIFPGGNCDDPAVRGEVTF